MLKLNKNEFSKVLPLFNEAYLHFPVAQAVIEKKLEGDIYVDTLEVPKTALIVSKVNWIYLIGDQCNPIFNDELLSFIKDCLMKERDFFVWCDLSIALNNKLHELLGDNLKSFPRMNFVLDKVYHNTVNTKPTISNEFRIERIDKSLINEVSNFFPGINMFWDNGDDFLENGVGFCTLHGDKIVCVCQSEVLVSSTMEFDIFTHKDYRNLNLGYFTSKALIDYCLSNNITPYWDCVKINIPSYKLAKKLGFKENKEYSCYFWSKNSPD